MLHQETKHAEENVYTCVLRTNHITKRKCLHVCFTDKSHYKKKMLTRVFYGQITLQMYIVFKNDSVLKDKNIHKNNNEWLKRFSYFFYYIAYTKCNVPFVLKCVRFTRFTGKTPYTDVHPNCGVFSSYNWRPVSQFTRYLFTLTCSF
jgi:hypothetical protein